MSLLLAVAVVCAIVGALISQSKNRPPIGGAVAGFLFGPIGVLIVAVLKKVPVGTKTRF